MSTYESNSWQAPTRKSLLIAITLQFIPILFVAIGILGSFIFQPLIVIYHLNFLWGLGYLYLGKPRSFFIRLGWGVLFSIVTGYIIDIGLSFTFFHTDSPALFTIIIVLLTAFLAIQLYLIWQICQETDAYNEQIKDTRSQRRRILGKSITKS